MRNIKIVVDIELKDNLNIVDETEVLEYYIKNAVKQHIEYGNLGKLKDITIWSKVI